MYIAEKWCFYLKNYKKNVKKQFFISFFSLEVRSCYIKSINLEKSIYLLFLTHSSAWFVYLFLHVAIDYRKLYMYSLFVKRVLSSFWFRKENRH